MFFQFGVMIDLLKEVDFMTLVKQESDRKMPSGQPYTDLYLVWRYDGRLFSTRVVPCFAHEFKYLLATALEVPKGEPFDKYVS